MPTTYPGRETQHDLGQGHSFTWLHNFDEELVGLVERHPTGDGSPDDTQYCGTQVAWVEVRTPTGGIAFEATHELVAGSPGDEQNLTVTPEVTCKYCPARGRIEGGKWVST